MRLATNWKAIPSGSGFNARHYVVRENAQGQTIEVFGDYVSASDAAATARTLNTCSVEARNLLCIRAALWRTCNIGTQQLQEKRMRKLAARIIARA